MGISTASLAVAIGARVKRERQERRWTLDQLAEQAGVSRRMVVNVEQGAANPSVGTLLRLSEALGVKLPVLVEPPAPTPVKVTRAGEGATLWNGEAGGSGTLVASTGSPEAVELWDWRLAVGERHASEAHTAETKELLQIHEGTLTVEVADQTFTLGVGDAMTFLGDVDHAYANLGDRPVRFSLAVHEPGIGAGERRARADA